jgi:hypothetical protein
MANKNDMVQCCIATTDAAIAGKDSIEYSGVTFDLRKGGMCSRYVRQSYGAVADDEWPVWAGEYAIWTERNLYRLGYKTENPLPGDIVFFNKNLYSEFGRDRLWDSKQSFIKDNNLYGHVGIVLSPNYFAENTSSANRGNPYGRSGTKKTSFSESGLISRVSGYYSVLPPEDTNEKEERYIIVQQANGEVLSRQGIVVNGRVHVPIREVVLNMGATDIRDRISDHNKVYINADLIRT